VDILVGLLVVLILGFTPMFFYSTIVWWFDRYEKEPIGLLVVAFLWGAVPAVIFSLIAQVVFDFPIKYLVQPGLQADLLSASFIAPATEETLKGLMILFLVFAFQREIDTPLDGIVYGGLVGCGFAATENVFYFLSELTISGVSGVLGLAFFRAFVFGLNHALFTSATGLGIAIAHTSPNKLVKIGAPPLGLALGMMLHAAHNAAMTLTPDFGWPMLIGLLINWSGVFALIITVVSITVREQKWIRAHLAEEVELGTLSNSEYTIIQSHWKRTGARLRALLNLDVQRWANLGRFYRLATKLAFAKQRWAMHGRKQALFLPVEDLRQQLLHLRSQG
jgi:RsiW-degrading membrane proteinase PrsW (M82 family)